MDSLEINCRSSQLSGPGHPLESAATTRWVGDPAIHLRGRLPDGRDGLTSTLPNLVLKFQSPVETVDMTKAKPMKHLIAGRSRPCQHLKERSFSGKPGWPAPSCPGLCKRVKGILRIHRFGIQRKRSQEISFGFIFLRAGMETQPRRMWLPDRWAAASRLDPG
jgi:hypothetical protein